MKLAQCKINVLGDSITEGHGTSSPDRVFWRLLESEDGADVAGYGISGTRIARQQQPSGDARMDRYFRTRVSEMRVDADVILVFGGTNDWGHGDAAMGSMEDRTDDTFYGAVHLLCRDLISRFPAAHIILMTPLHRLDEGRLYNSSGLRNVGTLRDYVEAMRQVAEYYGLPVLDLYACSGIQPEIEENRQRYLPDGLHPNDAGNRVIYRCVKALLESL